ncbi:tellurium resistance protein [Streptomyces lavendulocolor]|uniref:tellurium resistance protein n=1 Tax=Streptomyces lavendulocolor TaxID=67316 RepID=UPI003C308C95
MGRDERSDDRPRGVIRLRGERPPAETVLTTAAPRARITGRGALQANLNWLPGFDADLNLCCLMTFTDGTSTVVQALGDDYGSLTSWPYVRLDHDDRTGASSDGETLRVNLEQRARFRRLLFFVYVYEGAADFRRLGASVTVTAPGDQAVRILLDDSPPGTTACAVALAVPEGEALSLRREVRWFPGWPVRSPHEQIDEAYGFGIAWTTMSKPPRR